MNKDNLISLKEDGWTIVKGALSKDEVDISRKYFWDWLQSLGSGIQQDNIETWSDENWPGDIYSGFIGSHGISQSQFAWYVRSRPSVRQAFSSIWSSDDLICSMDSIICWRPWWLCDFEDWEPIVEGGLHIDQNPHLKPDFCCVQGMVVLYDVTEVSGGLQIVPGSHNMDMKPYCNPMTGDWVLIPKEAVLRPKLIEADAGDLILWDSRTVHGGKVGSGLPYGTESVHDLLRLAIPICMLPRKGVDKDVLQSRKEAYEKRYTMNHWPNEINYILGGDSHAINICQEPPYRSLIKEEADLL
jgi:hypothetical protein